MKKLLLFALTMILSLFIMAKHVTIETARKVAVNFYFEKSSQLVGVISLDELSIEKTFVQKSGEDAVFYVFTFTKGGFVMVSAETCLNPVLGYSLNETYSDENQPLNVQYWFSQFTSQVDYARKTNLQPEAEVTEKWNHYITQDLESLKSSKKEEGVGPLLTTLWDQGWPYNYYCPETPIGGSGGHTWAGCVATAIGQIFYYHRWPENGQGYTSYIPTTHPEYGVQFADFANTFYRYDEMVDDPSKVNTAIAEYLYHIAVSLQMDFDPNGSAPDSAILQPGEDSTDYHFKLFDSYFVDRDTLTDEQWKALLNINLDLGYPLYYSGHPSDSSAGHAWVCDGYQDEEYFHFNLGWGGQSNGYYTIESIAGYSLFHRIILDATPDTVQFEYPFYCSGADTLRGIEGSICDGSGPIHNYLNGTNATWLIDPQNEMDSVSNITLDVRCCEINSEDHLKIYDGEDNTAPLLAEINSRSFLESFTSTGNKVFVEFICDEENSAPGFKIDYHSSVPVFCNGMTTITDPIAWFDDGSSNFYYQNNANCTWMIHPNGCDSSLTLYFDQFNTEEGVDVLQVYDMQSQKLLAEYSGTYEEDLPSVESPSGKMLLMFSTDNSNRAKGWSAYYGTTDLEEDKIMTNLQFYPNPVGDELAITFIVNRQKNIRASLFSLTGNEMQNYDFGIRLPFDQKLIIPTNQLKPGIYFLHLQIGNEVVTKKIVKL